MNAHEATKQIEDSIESLRKAADSLAAGLPLFQKELKLSGENKAKLDQTSKLLLDAEAQLSSVSTSLASIESALLQSISAAKEGLHNPTISLEARLEMLRVCKESFSKLASAGFEVTIPEVGSTVDMHLHNIKGKAKSKLGKSEIADVISWGYKFPSGQSQLADVLVGDASLSAETEEPAPAAPPSKKQGISMLTDEDATPTKKTTKKSAAADLFDKLAEAAEKNK